MRTEVVFTSHETYELHISGPYRPHQGKCNTLCPGPRLVELIHGTHLCGGVSKNRLKT